MRKNRREGVGELRRRPETAPPFVVLVGQRGERAPGGCGRLQGAGGGQAGPREMGGERGRGGVDLVAAVLPGIGDGLQDFAERRGSPPVLGGEVCPAEERLEVGREEDGERPAARPGHRLNRAHVDGVDVGALLAVHLHGDEVLGEERGDRRVLERLALHDVAPVAGRVPDREEDRLVLGGGARDRLVPPGVPIDGVGRVLEQVRARLAGEAVCRTGWGAHSGLRLPVASTGRGQTAFGHSSRGRMTPRGRTVAATEP